MAIIAMAAAPIGRLTQNTTGQLNCPIRNAPKDGPTTADTPNTLETRPWTLARSVGV